MKTSTDKSFKSFVRWLRNGAPIPLLVAPLIFLSLFIITAISWRNDLSHSESIILGTFTSKLENTQQQYKGLEAFILSGLEDVIQKSLDNSVVTNDFIEDFHELESAAKLQGPPDDINKNLMVLPENSHGKITDKYVTDRDKEGFLFVPAMILGATQDSTNEVADPEIIGGINKEGSLLKHAILISRNIANSLREFNSKPVFTKLPNDAASSVIQDRPVQSFFLTSTGVIRLYELNLSKNEQNTHYTKQFKPTTFFPDRPYFWSTIKDEENKKDFVDKRVLYKVNDVFYRTKPYVDLGGNGIVVTLSKRIETEGITSGLFLDFSLGEQVKDIIKDRVKRLEGFSAETFWVVDNRRVDMVSPPTEQGMNPGASKEVLTKQQEELLKSSIVKFQADSRSNIFGQINVLYSDESGKLVFTVPLGPLQRSNRVVRSLLYCEIDLEKYERLISIKIAIIAATLVLCLIAIGALVVDYVMKVKVTDRAFQNVSIAMSQAPIAYCRLNAEDQIIDMNNALGELLGYTRGELINKQKFEDLLADQVSHEKYKRIQEQRRTGSGDTKYDIKLQKKDGSGVEVEVHAAGISVPARNRKGIPQTFGILLEKVRIVSGEAMIVKPYFGLPHKAVKFADLFVVMPFKSELTQIYQDHLTTVAKRLNLTVARADEIFSIRAVMLDIWTAICAAKLIIADCTGRNPNVFYEIGIAHAVGKPVILITQNVSDVPFDTHHIRHITYEYTPAGMTAFEKKLEETIKQLV